MATPREALKALTIPKPNLASYVWCKAPRGIDYEGARWTVASDGHALVAVRRRTRLGEESARALECATPILFEAQPNGTRIDWPAFTKFAARRLPPKARCIFCDGKRGGCSDCGRTGVDESRSGVAVKILGAVFELRLLRRVLATAPRYPGPVWGRVATVSAPPKQMLALHAEDWRAAVMGFLPSTNQKIVATFPKRTD